MLLVVEACFTHYYLPTIMGILMRRRWWWWWIVAKSLKECCWHPWTFQVRCYILFGSSRFIASTYFQISVLKRYLKMWAISTSTIYVGFSTLLAWMQLDWWYLEIFLTKYVCWVQVKMKTSFLLLVNMWQKKSWNLEQSLTWHDDDIKLFFINEEASHRYQFKCLIGQTNKGQWNLFFKVMVCNQFFFVFLITHVKVLFAL